MTPAQKQRETKKSLGFDLIHISNEGEITILLQFLFTDLVNKSGIYQA